MLTDIFDDNDRDKVEKIYAIYRGTMLYIATSIIHDNFIAEDAVVEAFIKIMSHIERIGEIDCPKTRAFVVIIARNTALDMLRRKNRNQTVPLDELLDLPNGEESILDGIIINEAYHKIADRIAKLNPTYSDVLLLHIEMGFSYDEIAALLDISLDNVKKRMSRARKMLRDMLGEDEFDGQKKRDYFA